MYFLASLHAGNLLLDVKCYEFFLSGCWIFVCLFSMNLSRLENEVTLCPLDATSGEVSEGAYLDIDTSYQMTARELVWAGLSGCPEFIPQCWRVTCSLSEHSPSIRLHCQYCTSYILLICTKKERNLNYCFPLELRAGARATLLHQTCFAPFPLYSSVHL